MPGREVGELRYSTVEFVLDAIAGWINKYATCTACTMNWGNAQRTR